MNRFYVAKVVQNDAKLRPNDAKVVQKYAKLVPNDAIFCLFLPSLFNAKDAKDASVGIGFVLHKKKPQIARISQIKDKVLLVTGN